MGLFRMLLSVGAPAESHAYRPSRPVSSPSGLRIFRSRAATIRMSPVPVRTVTLVSPPTMRSPAAPGAIAPVSALPSRAPCGKAQRGRTRAHQIVSAVEAVGNIAGDADGAASPHRERTGLAERTHRRATVLERQLLRSMPPIVDIAAAAQLHAGPDMQQATGRTEPPRHVAFAVARARRPGSRTPRTRRPRPLPAHRIPGMARRSPRSRR